MHMSYSQIKARLYHVHLLEQHCLANAIGLPDQSQPDSSASTDVHGLQPFAAAVDMGHWQHDTSFTHDP